jgi:mono/diheme cytochrome c family protein
MKVNILLGICMLIGSAIVISSCQSENDLNYQRYYTAGALVYQTHCQNCHGAQGEGLNALIPALTDTAFIGRNRKMLACMIKNGIGGSLVINGKPFNQQMPAQNDLSPIEIGQVVTFIGNSYENKLGLVDVKNVEKDLVDCVVELR